LQGILKAIVEQAKAGDIQAAKLILDKVLPSLKSIDVQADVEAKIPTTIEKFYAMNGIKSPCDMTDEEVERVIQGG
jgi:hypothetical protein